ncbi:MAG: hypothetical protein DRI46_10780, partial [Chloroflexi bacterium]
MIKVMWHLPFAVVGGAETLYASIIKFMPKTKFTHFVTCHEGIGEWVRGRYRGLAQVYTWGNKTGLGMAIKHLKPDVIMGTHGILFFEVMKEDKIRIPVIEIVHGSHLWSQHNAFMPKDWTRHLICVSKSAKEVFLDAHKTTIPTSVVLSGVDTGVFQPRRAIKEQAEVIAYMGRFLEEDKKLTKIIEAFKHVPHPRAKLHLIGGQPGEIVRLKHFARRKGLEGKVQFFPHSMNPEKFYSNIDIMTVRSEAEGYCNVVAEAMASGVPCVCYNFRGILDHIPPGTVAIASSQKEYQTKLAQVFRDFPLRQRMRRYGLDFIRTKVSGRAMAQAYASLIVRVLKDESNIKLAPKKDEFHSSPPKSYSSPIVGVFSPYWHGIATATKQVADIEVHWQSNAERMVGDIMKHKPRSVLLSGGNEGFEKVALILHNTHKIPVHFYYHGGISHYSFRKGLFGDAEYKSFDRFLTLSKEGVIKSIAVSSPGMEEY